MAERRYGTIGRWSARRSAPVAAVAVALGLVGLGAARAAAEAYTSADAVGAAHAEPIADAVADAGAAAVWAVVDTVRPGFLPPPGGVVRPVDLAVLPDGGFLVVDDTLQRAERFDAAGGVVVGYGGVPGDGAFIEAPIGVAVDPTRSRAYISDAVGRKVLAFDLGGGLQAAWAGFAQPEAATVGQDGRLYVYDRPKAALAVRRPDGTAEAEITVQRALSFSSELPSGLATSGRGTLFFAAENPVANAANVLYEFSADGAVIPPRTQLRWRMRDISFDAAGEMFVLDWTNRRIVSRLDRQRGEIGRAWPVAGFPVAMAARAADEVFLLYGASPAAPAAVAVIEGGREVRRLPLPRPAGSWFGPPLRLQVDATGRLWVIDELERAVRLTPDGREGDTQFTLHGLQEIVPLGDGSTAVVIRTRSSSSNDAPDDRDAPPPGIRRVSFERYTVRPGADPGIDLTTAVTRTFITDVTASDTIVAAASAPDADGRGAWVLDRGSSRLHHVVPGMSNTIDVATTPLPEASSALEYRDVVALPSGRIGVLHGPTRRLLVVRPDAGAPDAVALDVESALRIAALPDGRLAVLTSGDVVAILAADGRRQAVVPLPRPAGAGNEPASDIAAGPDGTVYVADRQDRAVYLLRAGTGQPSRTGVYLPWVGDEAAR